MKPRAVARTAFPYLVVSVGGFLIAYLGLFVFAFPAEVLPDDGRIPRVVGMTYDAASAALEKAGFHALKGQTRFHQTTPADMVLEQDPPAGSIQKRGAQVTLAVSGGQRSATVPEIAGSSQQQARIAIENAGFQFGSVQQATSDHPRGAVLASDPPAGSTLQLPATVGITISLGPATVMIPDLTGRTLADARSTLEQLALQIGSMSRDTNSVQPENTILSQAPAPGQMVSAGGRVNLRISRFPPVPQLQPLDTMPPSDSLPLPGSQSQAGEIQ